MRTIDRSDFGQRLLAARTYAGLGQVALSSKVGMSQSAYAEAERVGRGSSRTVQIAMECRVDPHWLATGDGAMIAAPQHVDVVAEVPSAPRLEIPVSALFSSVNLSNSILLLGSLLGALDKRSRRMLGALLADLAESPDEAEDIARKAAAVATAPKRVTRDPALSRAIQGRLDAPETRPAELHK